MLDLLVVTFVEEHLDGVRPAQQLVVLAVDRDLPVDIGQQFGVDPVFRLFYDHLLAVDMALLTQTQQAHDNGFVEVYVEHRGVLVSLISKEHGDRCEYHRGDGLSEPHLPLSVARHTHTRVVEDVIHDKHQYGYDDGYAQTSLADNGSQWGTDKEEDQARQRQSELLVSLNQVLTVVAVQVFGIFHLHVHICHHLLDTCQCPLHGCLLQMRRLPVIDRVEWGRRGCYRFHQFHRVVILEVRLTVEIGLGILIKGQSHAVVELPDRVEVVQDPAETLGAGVTRNLGHIRQIKTAIEIENDAL